MSISDTARLEAFSDGVFAIAITLLILEIKVPSAVEIQQLHGLWGALARRWSSYVGYVVWWTGRWGGRLLGSDLHQQGQRTITRRYTFGPISYAVATALAFVNVWLSLSVHLAVALWNARSERGQRQVQRA